MTTICRCTNPDPENCTACEHGTPPAFELAKLLAHKLARITAAPAHVVNDDGHAMLACGDDIGPGRYWTRDQIIFTAPVPE
jgi:hypothetical protein